MKFGECKVKMRIKGVYKDEQGRLHFRVEGKSQPMSRQQVISIDPLALVLYYEQNIKVSDTAK